MQQLDKFDTAKAKSLIPICNLQCYPLLILGKFNNFTFSRYLSYFMSLPQLIERTYTVKLGYNELGYNELGYNELGYNELGYNELLLITKKCTWLVGSSQFIIVFSCL